MMPKLNRLKPQAEELIPQLEVAENFWSRLKGLLGRSSINENQAMWIHNCNSIHTFFMNFAIDCVFVDQNLQVKAIARDVRPGRIVWPIWGARSVFEMKSGLADQLKIQVGEVLDVGS